MQMDVSASDLVTRCLAEYWDNKHSNAVLRSRARMQGVIQLLANEVRTWAPDKGQAKICHLAINEVADRLLRDSDDHDLQP
jgi:hypothetical protein